MSIFGKIKDAIFGRDDKPQSAPGRTTATPVPPPIAGTTPVAQTPASPRPEAAPLVSIENSLDSMPGADRLNWRTSIVDLMKLINVDSDYESRKALASEMGRGDYAGSAEDNVWLHQRVMDQLAQAGGQVPDSLR